MKTYCDNGYRYFYDTNTKFWTVYKIDTSGNQVGEADHYQNKGYLKKVIPELRFVEEGVVNDRTDKIEAAISSFLSDKGPQTSNTNHLYFGYSHGNEHEMHGIDMSELAAHIARNL